MERRNYSMSFWFGSFFSTGLFIAEKTGGTVAFRFVAEQVSHHPPVSAFHLECGQRAVRVYGHLSVKAKLMGMYAGTRYIRSKSFKDNFFQLGFAVSNQVSGWWVHRRTRIIRYSTYSIIRSRILSVFLYGQTKMWTVWNLRNESLYFRGSLTDLLSRKEAYLRQQTL